MRETWYVLEDGSAGDPREIAPDENGILRHKDGRAVAYAPHGPRSRGVDADVERAKSAADGGKKGGRKKADAADAKSAADGDAREATSPEDRELKAADREAR